MKNYQITPTIESTANLPKFYLMDGSDGTQIGEWHVHSKNHVTAWSITRKTRDCNGVQDAINYILLAYKKKDTKAQKAVKEQIQLF